MSNVILLKNPNKDAHQGIQNSFVRLSSIIEHKIISWINIDRALPLQIDITNACNLKCQHCYHDHHKNFGALELVDWINVLNQYDVILNRLGYKPAIVICGGEPLTSPLLMPLLEEIKMRYPGVTISILTNGTLINKLPFKYFELFKQIPHLSFQISLDGPSKITHDPIRGKGSFQNAIEGLKILQNNKHPINLLAVLSQRTALIIQDFFKLAKELNVKSIGFTRLIAQGNGLKQVQNQKDSLLSPNDLKAAYIEILKRSAQYKIPSSTQSPLYHLINSNIGRSGRFFEGLVVDYQGYILASSRSRIKLAHIYKEGLENTFLYNPLLQDVRKGRIDKCGECKYLKVCGGDRNAAYAATGNYLGPDPGCWI